MKKYRLVQVKPRKFSSQRMPLALPSQRANSCYHADPHHQCKIWVTWPALLYRGLGLSLGAQLVLTKDKLLYYSITSMLFPFGGEKTKKKLVFRMNRLEVSPRHAWAFCKRVLHARPEACPSGIFFFPAKNVWFENGPNFPRQFN